MGGGGKISVFDFHGNTSGQLLSGAKPFCHTLRKTAEHRGGIPFRQDILGESSGISHTLGPGRKRLHRPVVDTVGVLPEKPPWLLRWETRRFTSVFASSPMVWMPSLFKTWEEERPAMCNSRTGRGHIFLGDLLGKKCVNPVRLLKI